MDTDEYRTEVMRRRAREIAYNLASDGGISDADIAECYITKVAGLIYRQYCKTR